MATTLFIWLGSGRSRKLPIGSPGKLLDQAAKATLPVPQGAILPDEVRRLAEQESLIRYKDGRAAVQDATGLHDLLFVHARLPQFDHPVEVSNIDSEVTSGLVEYELPVLQQNSVDASDGPQLAQVLAAVWSISLYERCDVLLMEALPFTVSGHVALPQTADCDSVHHVSAGQHDSPSVIEFPVLTSAWASPTAELPPFAQRLQRLARGLRRTFHGQDLRLHWIDDGDICWIWRLAPLVQPEYLE